MTQITIDPARAEEYRAARKAIMARFTPQLKAMASNDPAYPGVWNARAQALRELDAQYRAA